MIRLEALSRHFDGHAAVEDISLEISGGTLQVLIGPSGCGKSTLLRLINRLIAPTTGRVLLDGVDTATLAPEALRRRIGYVIQGTGLFPHLTVAENIAVVPRLLGWPKAARRQRVEALMELVRLEPALAARYPAALSGGQQQRVGIARALAADPALLLMDEPFSALDPVTRRQLQAALLDIQQRVRKTIVFVTHDMEEAVRLGDRIALMQDGRLVQNGPPDALLRHPVNAFAAAFVGEERALMRLARHSVADFMRTEPPFPLAAPAVSANLPARQALSRLLDGQPVLLVTGPSGEAVGQIALQDFAQE